MDNESETGFGERLSFLERCDCGSNPFRGRIALVPISQYPVAKVLIYRAVTLFDNLLQAANQPPINAANRSLTRLRLSAVKPTMSATSNQQGAFSISWMVRSAIVVW